MNSTELKAIIDSPEFHRELEGMSSYLASIMQERPIVHLLAKHLWQRRYKFQLEAKRKDLVVDGKYIEFKFNWDRCQKTLERERLAAVPGKNSKKIGAWAITDRIVKDVIHKKPDIFVWIICSRDLSQVAVDDLSRICFGPTQAKYDKKYPGHDFSFVDELLEQLRAQRNFSVENVSITTHGDVPSVYHFRICEFA